MHTRRTAAVMGLAAGVLGVAAGDASATARRSGLVTLAARPESISFRADRAAMLVVDMQNAFASKGGMFDRAGVDITGIRAVIPAVRNSIAVARAAGLPVVFLKMGFRPDLSDAGPPTGPNLLKHAPLRVGQPAPAPDGAVNRILIRDTWDTDLIAEVRSEPGDLVLYKTRYSGFFDTDLHQTLKRRAVDTLIVAGCTTSVCVESTVRDAMYRDYRCIVLEDCTAEPLGGPGSRTNHQASLLTLEALFAWISDSQKLAAAAAAA